MLFTRNRNSNTKEWFALLVRWTGLLAAVILALLNPLACLIYCEVWHHPVDPHLGGPAFLCIIDPAVPTKGETPRIPRPPAPPKAAPELLPSQAAALPLPALFVLLVAAGLRCLRAQWSDRPPCPPPRGSSLAF